MSCWRFRTDLRDCPGIAAGLGATLLLAALLPWVAGVPGPWAIGLTAVVLGALPETLRSVPGRWCPARAIAGGPEGLSLPPVAGVARALPATRVLPGLVLLHVEAGGRRQVLWLPRSAMGPGEFRKLKVALRAARHGSRPAA